mmetsp:Transcript_29858/g.41993  ORF Transcript_29858/g.41993 Transcript_29858/m.41993 type:complete len:117 (-) Transcript_29858:28-378(-)
MSDKSSDVLTAEARKQKEAQIKSAIQQKLTETGENEKWKEFLRSKLVDCGWRDEMKNFCKDIIKAKGVENVTVEDLVAEMTPKGRSTIPPEIRTELLTKIRTYLATVSAPQSNTPS